MRQKHEKQLTSETNGKWICEINTLLYVVVFNMSHSLTKEDLGMSLLFCCKLLRRHKNLSSSF